MESGDPDPYAGVPQAQKFEGEICLLYFGGYGLGRFWIEGIRTDTLFIPGTTLAVSQVLSLCMVIFAVVTDIVVRMHLKKQPKDGKKLKIFKNLLRISK